MGAKDVLGRDGEQAAVTYLEGCGFRILDRNWRCADGEIDIVAVERHTFVVCEVKTRSGTRYGTPLEAVGRAKQARLRRLAVRWLTARPGRTISMNCLKLASAPRQIAAGPLGIRTDAYDISADLYPQPGGS